MVDLKLYNTTVCRNGEVFRWRLRDHDCNRFRMLLTEEQEAAVKAYTDIVVDESDKPIHHDDCNGQEFATVCRIVGNMSRP